MNEAIWAQLDHQRREAFQRSLSVASAGSVLLQTNINKIVQQLTLREFGLQAVLDRRPGSGNAAYINRRTAGTTGGEWVADTDDSTEETGSYNQVSFGYKTLLTKGKVTRKVQATARSYGDALATELIGKSEDFANALEDGCMNGDAAANVKQFSGALTLVNAISSQVVANSTLTTGSGLVLAKLDEAIDRVRGAGNRSDLMIVGSFNGIRKVNAALQAQQQFTNMTEIAAGFRVRTYDTIPLVVSTSMGNALTWSGTTNTAFSGGSTTSLLIINRRYMWLEELTPTTVMPLAKTTSQYDEFEMYADLALVLANTLGASLLSGISGS